VHGSGPRLGRSSDRVAVTGFFSGSTLLVNISLDNDSRQVPVQIDLGSGPLWTTTTSARCCPMLGACATCQAKGKAGHEFSGKPLTQLQSRYGAGNVTGATYVEKVQIGDFPGFSMIVGGADLVFETTGFYESPMEGIMGLGLSSLNEGKTLDPYWEDPRQLSTILMMWSNKVIDSPVITLALSKEGGELTLGEADSSQIDGEFSWTPVVRPVSPDAGAQNYPFQNVFGFWSFSIDAFTIGDTQLAQTTVGFLDSGYSGIGLQSDVYDEWFALASRALGSDMTKVPLEGTPVSLIVVPCADLDLVPSLSFTAAGQTWTLDGSDMAVDDPTTIQLTFSQNQAQPDLPPGSCVLMLIDTVPAGYGLILGTPFLEKHVTAFDATPMKEQLAIAKKKTTKPTRAPASYPAAPVSR